MTSKHIATDFKEPVPPPSKKTKVADLPSPALAKQPHLPSAITQHDPAPQEERPNTEEYIHQLQEKCTDILQKQANNMSSFFTAFQDHMETLNTEVQQRAENRAQQIKLLIEELYSIMVQNAALREKLGTIQSHTSFLYKTVQHTKEQ